MRRVVVTGLGIVSPVGNNVKTAWQNTVAGKSGVGKITQFDSTPIGVNIAAEVKDYATSGVLDLKEENRTSRFCKFAVTAGKEAVTDAGINIQGDTNRWGCSIGVGLGGLEDIEDATITYKESGPRRISPFFLPYAIPNMAAGLVSKLFNLKGPNICTTTACASGTHGIGEGFFYIANNFADVMVAGGAEAAISPVGIGAFASMKALSKRNDDPATASRPFDKDRDGFVMGEGCGLVVLEELEHAKKRGAKIYAEVVGYGLSGDAHHITAPAPNGEGGRRCMEMAVQIGKVPKDQVDHINAHGTSTKMNDHYETLAIRDVFGSQAEGISICSTKGVTGHCLGAAGGIEGVFLALTVHNSLIPPTANYQTPDPECNLDYTVKDARERKIRYALSNSFGFGGTNACVAFKRFS